MRIIARGASHIFPSMFQTPLPPPPEAAGMTDPCTDENHHSCKGFSEVACTNPSPKVWKPCSSDAVNLVNNSSPDGAQRILNSDANGISELEILLKQKTITRSEFDRLTELLHSRTIKPSSWQPTVIYEKGEANVSGQENENDMRSNLNIPTPALSLRNQLFREDDQNGHMLPRPIGRTAMHKISRSPYFKAASATNIKVHDFGSPGPIRRLRQKSNLISLSKDSQWPHGNRLPDPSTTLTSNGNESLKFSVEKPLVPQDYTSDLHDRENEDNKVANGKEKTCQSTTIFRDDLPSKLTNSMLQGRALKSMEDRDWPKFLNLKGKDKLDAPTDSHVQKPQSSISLKQGKIANTVESCPSISGVKVIETVGAVSCFVAVFSGKLAHKFVTHFSAPKFVTHFSGISEAHQNGHILSRPIGRTIMYRMSRSPYFKTASAINIKVHDLGSPDPIRRLRQKSNLISLSKDIQWPHGNRLRDPSTTLTSNSNESLKISVEKPLVPQDYTSDLHDRENENNKVANGKEKTCQSTTTFRDDLPSKLTTSMLQGRALKSMEDID